MLLRSSLTCCSTSAKLTWGGDVWLMWVNVLCYPVPYVDASAASGFEAVFFLVIWSLLD